MPEKLKFVIFQVGRYIVKCLIKTTSLQ